jgi:hypothetical protein
VRRYDLSGVQLGADGVVLDFGDTAEDRRMNGMGRRQQLYVPVDDPDLAEVLEAFYQAGDALLDAAVVAFTLSPPRQVQVVGDAEASPYDNPLERDHVEVDDA